MKCQGFICNVKVEPQQKSASVAGKAWDLKKCMKGVVVEALEGFWVPTRTRKAARID